MTTAWTTRRTAFTVKEAAKILRVQPNTLYRLCADDDFPHWRYGGPDGTWSILIPPEACGFYVDKSTQARNYMREEDMQLAFDFPALSLVPIKRYRDGTPKYTYDYERALWRNGHSSASR